MEAATEKEQRKLFALKELIGVLKKTKYALYNILVTSTWKNISFLGRKTLCDRVSGDVENKTRKTYCYKC